MSRYTIHEIDKKSNEIFIGDGKFISEERFVPYVLVYKPNEGVLIKLSFEVAEDTKAMGLEYVGTIVRNAKENNEKLFVDYDENIQNFDQVDFSKLVFYVMKDGDGQKVKLTDVVKELLKYRNELTV